MKRLFTTKQGWLFLAVLVLLLAAMVLVCSKQGTSGHLSPAEERAALTVDYGKGSTVIQVRPPTEKPREKNEPSVISPSDEIIVDVLNPEGWLQSQIPGLAETGSDAWDAGITLNNVAFDPGKKEYTIRRQLIQEQDALDAGKQKLEALPEDSPQRQALADSLKKSEAQLLQKTDDLLYGCRYFGWLATIDNLLNECCLVINDHIFPDIKAQVDYSWPEYTDTKDPYAYDEFYALHFKMALNADKDQWLDILGGNGIGKVPVRVSIAYILPNGKPEVMQTSVFPNAANEWRRTYLRANSLNWGTLALLACFALVSIAFVYLAFSTNVLREMGPDGLWHLSLGLCQMVFWFFIIFGSYIFLLIILGDYNTLTSQELILLGISAGTGLVAIKIGTGGDAETEIPRGCDILKPEQQNLDNEKELLRAAEAEHGGQAREGLSEADKEKSSRREAELRRRAQYYKGRFKASMRRALNDLISENNSGRPDFYRVQMLGWTVVLGVVFLEAVYSKLVMPQFSAEQLLLMGISNGTYLGFKFKKSGGEETQKTGESAPLGVSKPVA